MNMYKEVKNLLMQQLSEATEHAKWGNEDEDAEDMEARHDEERAALSNALIDDLMEIN